MAEQVYVFPASFAHQRLWFLDQLAPGSPFYNQSTVLRLEMPLDIGALERSLTEIVRRHEALRTTFQAVDGRPVQIVGPPTAVTLPVVDLSGLDNEYREAEVLRLATLD